MHWKKPHVGYKADRVWAGGDMIWILQGIGWRRHAMYWRNGVDWRRRDMY